MFKKLKAIWHAAIAVVVVTTVIAFFSVIVPVLLGLIAIAVVVGAAYLIYQVSKGS